MNWYAAVPPLFGGPRDLRGVCLGIVEGEIPSDGGKSGVNCENERAEGTVFPKQLVITLACD